VSAPRRWKDSPDAPIGMRELLSSAKKTTPIDERSFERGRGRIATLSIAPAAALAVGTWMKLALAGVVGIAATGAVVAVEMRGEPAAVAVAAAPTVRSPSEARASAASAAPVETAPPAAEPDAVPSPPSAAPPRVPAPPARPRADVSLPPARAVQTVQTVQTVQEAAPGEAPATARPKSTLSAELALLEDARAHRARDPERALQRLAEHRARHPAGALATERDFMEIDLLRHVGRVQDARERARALLARDPDGLHAARARAILADLDE
jgi:hypothetical protein